MSKKYTLIRSTRRTVSLQMSRAGEVIVRAPRFYPRPLIDRFVESKTSWINERQKALAHPHPLPPRYCTIEELQAQIRALVDHYQNIMNLRSHSIRFTQVKSYWGSCSPHGVLSFNLKLAHTSPQAVEYVVVHELSHLKHRGHGPKFWEFVARYYPQTNEIKALLRQFPRE